MTISYIIIMTAVLLSAVTFVLFGIDKHKAVKHRWRIPEATLLLVSVFGGVGGLLGMLFFHHKTRKWKFRILVPLFAVLDVVVVSFFLWALNYYHAGETALAAMQSDDVVSVERTDNGWLFDGPSEDDALIFYPGAKVEETAYAPLLRSLAEEKMDVYLIRMPLHLAFFGLNAADSVIENDTYDRYYLGGHSLGGAMAAVYAAGHEDEIAGEILLAAYPTKKTSVDTVLIYGSEDGVLNMTRVEKAKDLVTGRYDEYCIDGGSHAQFGDYGVQTGDGEAWITPEEQQKLALKEIGRFFGES